MESHLIKETAEESLQILKRARKRTGEKKAIIPVKGNKLIMYASYHFLVFQCSVVALLVIGCVWLGFPTCFYFYKS
jgi:hypothetical protein